MKRLNSINGRRNRCYLCDSEYHLSPRCPNRTRISPSSVPPQPGTRVPQRPPFPTISFGEQVATNREGVQMEEKDAPVGGLLPITPASHVAFSVSSEDSAVFPDTEATANLARIKWLQRRNSSLA